MPRSKVYLEGEYICAEMPALYLSPDGTEFLPMWREKKARILKNDTDIVCIPKPKFPTIIRTGRGWGRNGKDKYYIFDGKEVRKLVKRPVKRLHEMTWMTCLEDKATGNRWCFELRDGRITPAGLEMRL